MYRAYIFLGGIDMNRNSRVRKITVTALLGALATILIKWLPLRKKLRIFKNISNAKIEFN